MTKLPYEYALDGISNTQSINPDALGHDEDERIENLTNVLDGYFDQGAHHLNVNVLVKKNYSMLWNIQKKKNTQTLRFGFLVTRLNLST